MLISGELKQEIQATMNQPMGTLEFTFESGQLFDASASEINLVELVAGPRVFRLLRSDDFLLKFFYCSPGTGTVVASVDLKELPKCEEVHIALTWSTKGNGLFVGVKEGDDEKFISAEGVPSKIRLGVEKDGSVVTIGDEGVEVLGERIYHGTDLSLSPTASKLWQETLLAVKTLLAAETTEEGGLPAQTVLANSALEKLVTGFEIYCRARFLELEAEGNATDIPAFIKVVFSNFEREQGIPEQKAREAATEGNSFLEACVLQRRVNFQNYSSCKAVYNKTYGIKFGEIGLSSGQLERLQTLLRYRHRITHVSPMLSILNPGNLPPEFSNKEFAEEAASLIDAIVTQLHKASLAL